jgi:hypothetical protein
MVINISLKGMPMFSLFNSKSKLAKDNTSDYFKLRKSFLDKELLLKGIIYEETKLKEEFEENEKTLDKFFLKNQTHSPYFELFEDVERSIKNSSSDMDMSFIDNSGNVDWASLIEVKASNELNEVFVDSMSINLNINDVDKYSKILNEELTDVKENIGLYKSSWGYLASLESKLKKFQGDVDFLKNNGLYKDSQSIRVHFIILFNLYNTHNIDVEKQYFELEVINGDKLQNVELTTKECLKLLQLRDWGLRVKQEVNDFIELRESGVNLGKQNHILHPNTEDELCVDISNLDVN